MSRESGILNQMLDRLFASIVRGPSIDCKPANSRQRLDLIELAALQDLEPFEIVRRLMSDEGTVRVSAQVQKPAPRPTRFRNTGGSVPTTDHSGPTESAQDPPAAPEDEPDSSEQLAAEKAWSRQQSVVKKLKHIAEEARTYEEDTGVYILNIGFPLLHLPKHTTNGGPRILAPLAFVPIQLTISNGAKVAVEMTCRYSGEDRLVPNESLFAWIERQTGQSIGDLFSDEEGSDPWRELVEITKYVCSALELELPRWAESLSASDEESATETVATELAATFTETPKRDDELNSRGLRPCAVLGLFPVSNQGLLRDTQQMVAADAHREPLTSFLSAEASSSPTQLEADAGVERRKRVFSEERFVQLADPCQARAVRLARKVKGLVIHGPPGTGKSQTITNIIADHLSRDQRVLFVCDKRTALDVVANRLSHIGLGDLCALIHDTKRDQRDLYMGIRKQLDELTETFHRPKDEARIAEIDRQLQLLHDELLQTWQALMLDESEDNDSGIPDLERAGGDGSLHDLVGRWLAIQTTGNLPTDLARDITREELQAAELDIKNILRRGIDVEYSTNPWPNAIGIDFNAFLQIPMDRIRDGLKQCETAAAHADETLCDTLTPFRPEPDPREQARVLTELADRIESAVKQIPVEIRSRWSSAEQTTLASASAILSTATSMAALLREHRPDAEIDIVLAGESLSITDLVRDISHLTDYQTVASKWWSFLAFSVRKKATAVVRRYGLPMNNETVNRVLRSLRTKRAKLILRSSFDQLAVPVSGTSPADLAAQHTHHEAAVSLLSHTHSLELEPAVSTAVREVLSGHRQPSVLLDSLRASMKRAEAIEALTSSIRNVGVFSEQWIESCTRRLCAHERVHYDFAGLCDQLNSLEEVLRIEDSIQKLPSSLSTAVRALLEQESAPDEGFDTLHKALLGVRISDQIASVPVLKQLDGRRIESIYTRMTELQHEKMRLVRRAIAGRWVHRQRERLLVSTGSRLNSLGAEVKRRLLTRGQHAMRIRQVIHHGQSIEGGDPLFDLRPVWMASPETVAQIFPREQFFDIVIFDEASQCRLEEALPVLTRAKRVVIAGDPKQLPPTRFFESAVVASEHREIETDQDLFEIQQTEVEDLLAAALNLEIEHAYLDVHYRSRNSDLIHFSNEQFYSSRLQALPGHPSNFARFAPIQLTHARGVYDSGRNEIEADRVVQIVQDLLKRAEPPSIGIASFNVAQRDLIIDKLDEAAEEDPEFARRLAAARTRRGAGAFEGLFVKNLENVQGDERDHIIISTTYGPNDEGRFYRRFGPLLQAGGGRRLNVLVTRARQEVHLVTSIPPEYYRALPPIPEGQVPGGAWLLFAYLNYAEVLAKLYEKAHEERANSTAEGMCTHRVNSTRSPSSSAEAIGSTLASRGSGNEVYWGNDGFCIDIALDHPHRIDDVTIGVEVDMTRFKGAADPVEWEIFRTQILETLGWKLKRVWSTALFRDPTGTFESIDREVEAFLIADQDPGAIPTWQDDSPDHAP
ncbi:MAG: AAA domain-containing protein [Phycisphaerales bacterium JB065]